MDIWRWVHGRQEALHEDGQHDLVEHIDNITTYAVDDKFDLVDQIYNAAIPMCRSLDDKWLELFFRHWRLQAHVLKNYDAKGLLPEAISLLDFAHSDDTKDCPQRICAVQDLAACYGIKDGPGFADERISVCKETLAQIDGSWPCYECVSGELLDALMDANKLEQAEAEIKTIDKELSHQTDNDGSELIISKTRLNIALGKYDDAWTLIENAANPYGGDGFRRSQTLVKTQVLCHLGRWEEAKEICPSFDDALIAAKYFTDWCDIQNMLVTAGQIDNTSELRHQFHTLAEKLVARDANRVAFNVYAQLVTLCLSTKEKFRAGTALTNMQTLRDNLNWDLGASDQLAALTAQYEALTLTYLPIDFYNAAALLDHDVSTQDEALHYVETGLETWPGDIGLLTRKSDILQSCFKDSDAFALLANAYETHKGFSALEDRYGTAFIKKHGFEKYQSEFPMDDLGGLTREAIWNRGFTHVSHIESKSPELALKHLQKIHIHWPEDVWLLERMAQLHLRLKDFDALVTCRKQQVELDPEQGNHKWDLLIAATIIQDTDLVLSLSKTLGLTVEETGRFAPENYGSMRLQMSAPDGDIIQKGATRIGPVTARLTSVSHLHDKDQTYGREVVFDPSPLNVLDQKDDDGDACDKDGYYNRLYPAPLRTLHDPQYKTYTLDGLHPGDDALERLSEAVVKADFTYQKRSTDSYKLTWMDGETEREDNAVYIYLLSPDGQEAKLNDILKDINKTLPHPLVWPELAEALGDKELLETQVKISEKYGMEPE